METDSLAIIGSGGFGREVALWSNGYKTIEFYIDDHLCTFENKLSELPIDKHSIIAIGSPEVRRAVANRLPKEQLYTYIVHKTAITSVINLGLIMCPYSVITTNVKIGKHLQMNLHSDIGHDCVIGDFVTLSPSARVSGNCIIGNNVYLGTNAVIREGVKIVDNCIIGAGAVVLKDIRESGIYVGLPAKKINT